MKEMNKSRSSHYFFKKNKTSIKFSLYFAWPKIVDWHKILLLWNNVRNSNFSK